MATPGTAVIWATRTLMTALKRVLSLATCSLLLLFALSCATGRPPTPVLPLVISPAALPAAVINVPYSATLTSVGGMGPFTWAMSSGTLPPGLTLSPAGVISGTPTVLGPTTFKVQVTDSQTPIAAVDIATKTITVSPALAVSTTSLTSGSVGVPYTASLSATGGVPPYTWSITSGTLPAGLTLSSSGFISGTPTNQESQTFTVQVSDSESPPATASAPLTLTINGPTSRLNGTYVFSFSGYNGGNLVEQAGTFSADGNGNITAGLMDSNSLVGVKTSLTFTGTYSIGSTNTGPMTLNIPTLGIFTYQVAAPASGTIRFIQNGNTGNQGTGYIRKVTSPTKITLAQLAASWAFGGTGADVAASRYAAAGTFTADATGAWTALEDDANDNGTVTHNTAGTGNFLTIDPVTQRGTAAMTVNSVTTNFSFYPVSTGELVMLSIDPVSSLAPLSLFTLYTNPGNWSNSALNTTTVAQLQGSGVSNNSSVPYGLLAIAIFNGSGGLSVTTDENLGGTMSANKYPAATYNIATNGRATVSGFGSNPIVMYFSGGTAFTLVGDAAVTAGTTVPQFGSPYTNSSISGSYQGATLQTVLPTVTVEDDSASADGNGNLALTYDISGPGGPQQGLTAALTYSVDTTGRAPLVNNGTTVGIAYVVTGASGSSGKILVLSTDANAKINDLEK
jgi:Putative Ig domain